jgi:hypothetical protein
VLAKRALFDELLHSDPMTTELDLAVRCPTCRATLGVTRVLVTEVPRRAATHAARRAAIARMIAPFAEFSGSGGGGYALFSPAS